ncbi:RNA polymerase II C-terminal domain phosphatase-like 5 [Cardamine amara subsp. amara]|uniref:RNA polymerase II C-terminal domain phosphatase-like n=1 Tax=Cardamine amara subsp. amara TaxID=228776 RepID=A0ABD1A2Q7_CARAN
MSLVESLEPVSKRRKIDPEIKESLSPNCNHWFVHTGICISCNSTVGKSEGRSFDYLDPEMRMSLEAITFTKRVISQTTWTEEKKLHLVLDLDHTLIHTIRVPQLPESEKYLTEEAESRNDLWRFNSDLPDDEALIKLRPFVHQFLKEVNEMFILYVYTKGGYDYARLVLELIDPDKIYFGQRVITRKESPGLKTLEFVLADERGIVIVDDNRNVWPDHKSNLVQILKYKYFKSNDNDMEGKKKRDESDEDGPLATVLSLLKDVHKRFFSDWSNEELDSMDVRPLLTTVFSTFNLKKTTSLL